MMAFFPVFIKAEGNRAVLFGSGREAEKKKEILEDFGFITEWVKEGFSEEILSPIPEIVVSAITDEELSKRIYDACRARNIPINTVDNPPLCTFYFSANIKTKHLTVGVSTGGMAPGGAGLFRDRIRDSIPDNADEIIEKISEIRRHAQKEIPDAKRRREYIREKSEKLLKYKTGSSK